MKDRPFNFSIDLPKGVPSYYEHHLQRFLSSMDGQFYDMDSYNKIIKQDDPLLYEVYEISRPEVPGELIHGISILYSGLIGNEYHMTKGHFHTVIDTAEIYYCLHGKGVMVMETPEGDWSVEQLEPGKVLYVPPRWAHRSVNIHKSEPLISFFNYPGNAGHDYGTIEFQGYRKLVVKNNGHMKVIDNPRWKSPKER